MTTRPAAVIGGGFSGAITAVQLNRRLRPDQKIIVFEPAERIGSGLAYATDNAQHLLNVRAANMSAFPDEPADFENWLKNQEDSCHATEAGLFSSRGLYARYIGETFEREPRLQRIRCTIADCRRDAEGFVLTDEAGQDYPVAAVVLATGHVSPAPNDDPRLVANPWDLRYLDHLDKDQPILILGTALTMVDILFTLRRSGYRGPVTALSRRGLLPQPHRASASWPTPHFLAEDRESVRRVMRRLRQEVGQAAAQGIGWRAVIDSIRPLTADLWKGWPIEQRQRFLRHARRWWDIHRHRMAPPNAATLDEERRSGGLTVAAGRDVTIRPGPEGLNVTWRSGGGTFQRVINATGLESLSAGRGCLIDRLLKRGLIRLDSLQIGLDVTDDLAVLDGAGTPVPGLWAVGPIVRGTFWECIAVPDIRRQAADCATKVSDYLAVTTTFPVI